MPNVMLGFYALVIGYAIISILISLAYGEVVTPQEIREIFRDSVVSLIWGAFFMKSERVKETFTRRLNQPITPISQDSIPG